MVINKLGTACHAAFPTRYDCVAFLKLYTTKKCQDSLALSSIPSDWVVCLIQLETFITWQNYARTLTRMHFACISNFSSEFLSVISNFDNEQVFRDTLK